MANPFLNSMEAAYPCMGTVLGNAPISGGIRPWHVLFSHAAVERALGISSHRATLWCQCDEIPPFFAKTSWIANLCTKVETFLVVLWPTQNILMVSKSMVTHIWANIYNLRMLECLMVCLNYRSSVALLFVANTDGLACKSRRTMSLMVLCRRVWVRWIEGEEETLIHSHCSFITRVALLFSRLFRGERG